MCDNQMEAIEMGQSTISVRLDDTIKKQFDSLCAEFGMSASTAFNIYARTVVRQRKIPFEITAENDPFYGESNAKILKESIEQMEQHPERNEYGSATHCRSYARNFNCHRGRPRP